LSRRVQKIVASPPLSELSDLQRRELHEALLDADTFEDLSGKWQAAILKAQKNRPDLRIVGSGYLADMGHVYPVRSHLGVHPTPVPSRPTLRPLPQFG
jgi:hypothetical protein